MSLVGESEEWTVAPREECFLKPQNSMVAGEVVGLPSSASMSLGEEDPKFTLGFHHLQIGP